MIRTLSTETFTTTVIYLEYNEESYKIIHREDGDGYFVPDWQIEDEDGEEIWGSVRTELIEWTKRYLDK